MLKLKKHILPATDEKESSGPDFVSPLNLFKTAGLHFTPKE